MSLVADPIDQSSNPVILITAGYDHTIRFWEALSGHCHRVLQHPESQVNALSITKDKRFVAAAGNVETIAIFFVPCMECVTRCLALCRQSEC